MRFAVRVNIPVETGNAAFKSGKLAETMGAFMQKWKPEAAFFYLQGGKRGATFFVNLDDPSQMPAFAEPLFENLNAEIEATPCMNFEDLKKGMAAFK